MQSHYANFSQDFISPDKSNHKTPRGGSNLNTTLMKRDISPNQQNNNSVMLDTSGATTFA